MALSHVRTLSARGLSHTRPLLRYSLKAGRLSPYRTLFGIFSKNSKESQDAKEPTPILTEDNLFHPFSQSPFPAIRARGEAIKQLASCPTCASKHQHLHAHVQAQPRLVSFECPDCGWPTHCSEEHWREDEEHKRYCGRLREVNEDDHDLRSGRRMREFEFPGPQDSESAISFANWDVFWYTRGFPSMDTERSRRHASKVLTYPITIGSVLHQYSYLTVNNQRLTPEGSRSLAALRTNLHPPVGAPETEESGAAKPQMRIFVLGARAESSLPPNVWEQLTMLFPSATVHVFFIGPQVSLPKATPASGTPEENAQTEAPTDQDTAESNDAPPSSEAKEESQEEHATQATSIEVKEEQETYVPNIYEPPTPRAVVAIKRTRNSVGRYGVPSYTTPYKYALSITGLRSSYLDVHAQFQETFDPYTDCFFLFSPGFGFPSAKSVDPVTGQPLLQISSPTEWGPVLPLLLASKCPIFVTGFSPADVERDVRSLSTAPGVAGEFDWVITPGPNAFASEKWEVADFDPRVAVKTNWGIWGIRGKSRDIRERSAFESFFQA